MYHPDVIAARRASIEELLHEQLPHGLQEHSIGEVEEFRFRMQDLFDKHGQMTRGLTKEEQTFILHEQILGKIDFPYWAQRNCVINLAGQSLGPLYPLWESQRLILEQVAAIEKARYDSQHADGVVVNVLKARQLGASTLIESMLVHRTTTHAHVNALLASDVPESSAFLFDMLERVVDHLPWYMLPTVKERVKNDEILFGTESHVFVGASKSTRGGDKTSRNSSQGKKGQLGRGKTLSCVHLSELATWTQPEQIDSSLEPGIPISPLTLYIKESTGQGHNWWYHEWSACKKGKGRAVNVFIPWYAEKTKWHLQAPVDWTPSADTLAVAARCEADAPRWLHKSVRLTREQLYWYETTRANKQEKGVLDEFLQEYPCDDEEAFQYSGKSAFPLLIRERVKLQARPLIGLIEVAPNRRFAA
jgi:hypothetical protein